MRTIPAPNPLVAPTFQTRSSQPRHAESPRVGPQSRKLSYYDYGALLSHHGVYNFLIGGRGLGKTFGAKRRAIKRNIRYGELFIYLRRYTDELKGVRETFFADIQHEFPDWDMEVRGNRLVRASAASRFDRKREWVTMGYLVALSTAQQLKSASFHLVTTIIFDEFIIEKGVVQYLPNEANVFNGFFSTVDRWQDKTTVFFLANSVSITNPYFIEYGIMPREDDPEFVKMKDGFIVCHFPDAADFASEVRATRFGRFIEGTDYAEYAIGNQFADNHLELVDGKTAEAKYAFTLETRLGAFSVWWDIDADLYFAQAKRPGHEKLFTLLPERMSEEKVLLLYNDLLVQRLRNAFRTAKIMFDTPATRNSFVDVFRKKS